MFFRLAGIGTIATGFACSLYNHRSEFTLFSKAKFRQLKIDSTEGSQFSLEESIRKLDLLDKLQKIEEFQNILDHTFLHILDIDSFFNDVATYLVEENSLNSKSAYPEHGSKIDKKSFISIKLSSLKTSILEEFPLLQRLGDTNYSQFMTSLATRSVAASLIEKITTVSKEALTFFWQDLQEAKTLIYPLTTKIACKTWNVIASRCLSLETIFQIEKIAFKIQKVFGYVPKSIKAVGIGILFPGSYLKKALCGAIVYGLS
ncbi:MAG: hypothetical protein WCP39_04275 [Chlamydiota bacterium]